MIEVASSAFTGSLSDGRHYVQRWVGWQLRSYHWISPEARRWLDTLIGVGPLPRETAVALGVHAGMTPAEVASLHDDFGAKGLIHDAPAPRDAHRPVSLNLGALPHSAVEGHFNHELLRTASPYFVKFELTTRCNMRCGYCYVKDLDHADVAPDVVVTLLKKLRAGGVVELSLTGLEATLHPRLPDVILAADRLGFRVALLTNGLKFDGGLLDALLRTRRTEVRITYHSHDDDQFDAFTRRKGARRAVWGNMLALRDAGIPVVATIVLNKTNETLVRETVARVAAEGIPYVVSNIILPYVNGKLDPLASNSYLPSMGVVADLVVDGVTHRRRRECTALRSKAWLSATGELFPCELTRGAPIGNLLEHDLLTLWGSAASEQLRRRYAVEPTGCISCSARKGCPRCPALSEAENARPDSVYTPFCDTTAEVEQRRGSSFTPPARAKLRLAVVP